MGQDGNTIEIVIDAADTLAAVESAKSANQSLKDYKKALDAFSNHVTSLNTTTTTTNEVLKDLTSLLNDVPKKLRESLDKMHENVISSYEPKLEKNLDAMVSRVVEKVCGKVQGQGASRTQVQTATGKQPASPAVTVAQPPQFQRPDVKVDAKFNKLLNEVVDPVTGRTTSRIGRETARVTTTRTKLYEETDPNTGEISQFKETIAETTNTIKKASKAEIDRASAIRKEITGALIAVHVMKVTAQGSQVFNAGLQVMNAGFSHLLNNIMLPMMPVFVMIGQILHTVANVVAMLPGPVRQLLGYLILWKATSMLFAAMPIREVLAGFTAFNETLKGGGNRLQMFVNGVRAFFQFMNSGIGGQDGILGGIRKRIGKRASGGPVLGSGAYIVGEKGPELFIPKTSGTIIPNHKIGRADGGEVTAAPFGGDPLGNLGAGLGIGALAYMLTGSPLLAAGLGAGAGILGPEGIASGIASIVSSDIGSNFIASINVLTGMIQSILAPLAPIMGVIAITLGAVSGIRGAGGGGDRTADTVYRVGTEQLKATGKMNFGVQSAVGVGARGTNKILSMILIRLGNCLYVDPCNGMIAQFDGLKAALLTLPALITQAISITIPDLAAKIKYTIETIGEIPIVRDVTARIRYVIETVGSSPIVQDVAAKIRYVIETVGTIPETVNRSATIEYTETIRPLTSEQIKESIRRAQEVASQEAVDISSKLKEIAPVDVAKLIESVETLAKENPVEIKVKILADGTPEFTFAEKPKIVSIADIRSIDTSKLSPVRMPTTLYVPEGTVPKLPEGTSVRLPAVIDSSNVKLPKIVETIKLPAIAEVLGFVGDGKGGYTYTGKFKGGTIDMSGAAIPGWEYTGNGMYRKIGAFEGPIEFKVPDAKGIFDGIKWGEIGKGAGGAVGFGILDGLREFMTTGKINWGDFFTRNVVYLVAGGVIRMFAGALVAEIVGGIALAVLVHEVKGLFDPLIQRALDSVDTTGFLGNVFGRIFMPENNAAVANVFGPVLGGIFTGAVDTAIEQLSNYPIGKKVLDALRNAFANAGDLGNILGVGQNLAILLSPSTDLVTKLDAFNNLFRQTVQGGIPVDVNMDVASVTKTIETIASTVNKNGTYTYNPTGSTQPLGTNPTSGGVPIQGPLAPGGTFADGGRPPVGMPSLVGERGPELFVPDGTGASGGSPTINFSPTFNVTTNNPRELVDTVMRELKLELARVKM